jgi:hypothetical protein
MTSNYIQQWTLRVDNGVKYWCSKINNTFNYNSFINDPNILNFRIAQCSKILLDHQCFPEIYYGSADDSICKLAVVLFYNPGKPGPPQRYDSTAHNSLMVKYTNNGCSYSSMASKLDFIEDTVNKFWEPQKSRLKKVLFDSGVELDDDPFFMDLIPWHSANFKIDQSKFKDNDVKNQALQNVLLPAILLAKNSRLNQIGVHNKNRIAFFCIGAKYSNENILSVLGFTDYTDKIELINNAPHPPAVQIYRPHLPKTILTSKKTICHDGSANIKVWRADFNDLVRDADVNEWGCETIKSLKKVRSYIVIINVWNNQSNMNIPNNIGVVVNEILSQI